MWFLTNDESRIWSQRTGYRLDDAHRPLIKSGVHSVNKSLADMKISRLTWLSRAIAEYLEPFDECLLWVTLWGVWGSSENLHLYYRLRESYGDRRQLSAGPGHLFAVHEDSDLATFVQLGLMFGWDFYLLTSPISQMAFVSHDEFIQIYADHAAAAQKGLAIS
jgi:hypothetical protein